MFTPREDFLDEMFPDQNARRAGVMAARALMMLQKQPGFHAYGALIDASQYLDKAVRDIQSYLARN